MWFTRTAKETLQHFQVDRASGLTSEQVDASRKKHGENKLEGKPKKGLIALFFAQLKDMLIYVLFGAALITLIIGEYVDTIIILLVVVLNAAIGVFQESKAEKAIEALQKMASPKALVRRNGETVEIDAKDIVPGDIVILDAGRYVPADIRLIESVNLQIEESALTGESVPTEKDASLVLEDPKTPVGDRANMAFMSTLVTYGRGEGVAVATGMQTEMGRIAKILDEDGKDMTPLQKRLEELGKTLGFIAIGICVVIFAISYFQGRDLFEMFLTAISLAVAAIPEGLPAIVAIVLALGVTRMTKVNAIVKKLTAVETLGSVNIICSDKTGTLTQNRMTVVQTYTAQNLRKIDRSVPRKDAVILSDDEKRMLEAFILCTDATYENGHGTGDPTEVALVELGDYFGIKKSGLEQACPRKAERPFDSDRKRMSTLNRTETGYRIHTKGAIDQLLQVCRFVQIRGEVVPLSDEWRNEFLAVAEQMSNEALRVLAVAYRDTDDIVEPGDMEQELVLVGLAGMIDPPRLEVKDSIRQAFQAGITPVMITGDHRNTAVAIAKQLGIARSAEESITGAELDRISDDELAARISRYRVFARVSPEHKVKIVKAFKANGNIVSMTGDGVNDAPSLKIADIGVAMGITGTDVSKGASDMILADDNFSTIVRAVEEGRNIYNNIKKSVIFLLSCNLGEVITILAAILFFWPVPLLATQILWINLVTDSLPAIALGVDPGDKDVIKKKPRNPRESFFAQGAAWRAIVGGLLIGIFTLFAFCLGIHEHGYTFSDRGDIPEEVLSYARTMAFVVIAASQLFYSLSLRNQTKTIFRVGLFTNRYLIGAIAVGLLLQLLVISVPAFAGAFRLQNLSLADWGTVLGLAVIPFLMNEFFKLFYRNRQGERTNGMA